MSTFFSCIYRSLCYNENKACLKKILYVGSRWTYDPDFCDWKFLQVLGCVWKMLSVRCAS